MAQRTFLCPEGLLSCCIWKHNLNAYFMPFQTSPCMHLCLIFAQVSFFLHSYFHFRVPVFPNLSEELFWYQRLQKEIWKETRTGVLSVLMFNFAAPSKMASSPRGNIVFEIPNAFRKFIANPFQDDWRFGFGFSTIFNHQRTAQTKIFVVFLVPQMQPSESWNSIRKIMLPVQFCLFSIKSIPTIPKDFRWGCQDAAESISEARVYIYIYIY